MVSRRAFLATTAAASGTIAGCTLGQSNADEATGGRTVSSFENRAGVSVGATFDAVKRLARDEGPMTVYTTTDREAVQSLVDAATEKYPYLDVDVVTGGSSNLLTRWNSEYESGNVTADVFDASSTTKFIWQAGQNMELSGEFMPSFERAPDRFKDSERGWIATVQYLGSVFYNTDQVSESDASTWLDLLTDDRWTGKLGWDPTPNMFMMTWFLNRYGRSFFQKLDAQRPHWVDSHTDLVRLCGAGEFPVAFSYTHKMGRFGEKLPVDYFKFSPHPGTFKTAVINDKAKRPNSAILFLNWFTSKAGQKVVGEGQYIPWHPDASYAGYPSVYPSDEYQIEHTRPGANIEKTSNVWNEVVDP